MRTFGIGSNKRTREGGVTERQFDAGPRGTPDSSRKAIVEFYPVGVRRYSGFADYFGSGRVFMRISPRKKKVGVSLGSTTRVWVLMA